MRAEFLLNSLGGSSMFRPRSLFVVPDPQAVPFEDLWEMPVVPPEDGDMWRLNAYRIERGKPDDKSDDWYAAFSPTYRGSFHTPWQFGRLYFKK